MAQAQQQTGSAMPPQWDQPGLESRMAPRPDHDNRPEPMRDGGAAPGPSQAALERMEPGDVKFAEPPARESLGG